MNRPSVLQVGGTLYWVILTRNPDTSVLKDADSTPTVAVRKNGASTADSVTVTKRSATTGIYDCSYNPASEAEGDKFTFEESVTITGTTTAQATYQNNWDAVVIAVERGTDNAATSTQATNIETDTQDIQSRLPASLISGRMNSDVGNIQANAVNASALATDAVQEIQASTLAPNAFTTLQRTIEDTKAITFSWPVSGATITGQKSVDNGAYSAVSGAIAFLRTESNRHYYTLAYNAADRLTVEGTIRYKMTDGTYTKYFNLHVYDVTNAVTVYPLSGNAPDTIEGTTIKTFLESKATIGPISVFDTNNDPVDLSGVLEIIISKKWRGDILVIPNASITRSGVDNNQFSFSVNGATSIPGEHTWAIKRVSDNDPLMFGDFIVQQVANKD